ncbi:hypothetical protein Pyn_30988 [Prunus yedoensis var. nudiflora]|uniref:Uncharacterized protein n=1 Tax=Prunus yedoensis var. nudiflora TaxID=2094558 RepID=A0A314ZBD6_PRUYE|nr:hypothetical protein Pyn_30988 [Prunus yedoensis var. nudiflora]
MEKEKERGLSEMQGLKVWSCCCRQFGGSWLSTFKEDYLLMVFKLFCGPAMSWKKVCTTTIGVGYSNYT